MRAVRAEHRIELLRSKTLRSEDTGLLDFGEIRVAAIEGAGHGGGEHHFEDGLGETVDPLADVELDLEADPAR